MSLKNSKRALVRSAVSLALCGAMFVGGTLAYFTKTVSISGNTISTKNFDVEITGNINGIVIPGTPATSEIEIKNTGDLDFTYNINVVMENKGNKELDDELQITLGYGDKSVTKTLTDAMGQDVDLQDGVIVPAGESVRVPVKVKLPDDTEDCNLSGQTASTFKIDVIANQVVNASTTTPQQ